MSPNDIDDLFAAGHLPPVDLSQERVDGIIGGVLSRLAKPPRAHWWSGWREWLVLGAPTVSPGRFAAVLTIAVIAGIVVGAQVSPADATMPVDSLFSETTLFHTDS